MKPEELSQRLNEIAGGFQASQLLFVAVRAGVFEKLMEPRTAEQVAAAFGWSPRGTRMLLDGLLALELVEKQDGIYQNAPISTACLVPGAPTDQRHILTHKANGWAGWGLLEEAVRTGTSALGPRDRSQEDLRSFICGMADIARMSARSMLEAVDLAPYRRMLDVGGGPGAYSIAFMEAHSGLEATIFDVPDVIPIAREQVEAAGLRDRVSYREGDLTRDPFESGYDLVLVSNIIHSFSTGENQALIRKCFEALEPGGLLILKDFLLDPGRTGPPFGLIFAVHMLVHTEGGDTYTLDEAAAWTDAAGFQPGRVIELTPHTRLWLARKPGKN